ncbi:IS5 family transposase [Natribacillus halophilus]|uniref:Transposase domain n=1 Tax=Natribacillus halophilus TaxID=549003 RepID=A0A1G8JX10_9BACI|nr:IS5 family transposase [Natribacillus halophilus]SDI35772.1 Transposase domain [Natribacillus halophilus]
MYHHSEQQMLLPYDFFLPFGGKLNPDNRWVVLASMIPWWKVEEAYMETLKDLTQGNQAYSVRMALGALIIKEKLDTSDRETVEQITENPYLQYFLGLPEFTETAPFDGSSMTHFRKRISREMIDQVNAWIVENQQSQKDSGDDDDDHHETPSSPAPSEEKEEKKDVSETHQGKLLIDATCAPADITYPTDLKLLNEAREKLEAMIDALHEPFRGTQKKPRTYRNQARQSYLSIAKQKSPKRKKVRKAIRKQLGYVKRDLNHLEELSRQSGIERLSRKQYRELLVIQELYRQQRQMFETKTNRIEDRGVSIHQPHVRPIVRGKAHMNVEFGAKLSMSLVDGWAFLDNLQWDAYHEATDLPGAVEAYVQRKGVYPDAVLADKIYLTRENRKCCKERGIRLTGPKLGRPSKQKSKEQKQIEKQDAAERNAIEGKFGEGKRTYGLGLIRACLRNTSETVISLQVLVMNLSKALREHSFFIFFMYLDRGVQYSKGSPRLLD